MGCMAAVLVAGAGAGYLLSSRKNLILKQTQEDFRGETGQFDGNMTALCHNLVKIKQFLRISNSILKNFMKVSLKRVCS